IRDARVECFERRRMRSEPGDLIGQRARRIIERAPAQIGTKLAKGRRARDGAKYGMIDDRQTSMRRPTLEEPFGMKGRLFGRYLVEHVLDVREPEPDVPEVVVRVFH